METHGPLGTLWVGLGLGAFYIALIWINSLLGLFTTPLFIVPMTWLLDRVQKRPIGAGGQVHPSARPGATVYDTDPRLDAPAHGARPPDARQTASAPERPRA